MQAGRQISAYAAATLGAIGIACCVTPLLPWVLGALGAQSLLSFLYRDIVLLPFAAVMFAIAFVLYRSARA